MAEAFDETEQESSKSVNAADSSFTADSQNGETIKSEEDGGGDTSSNAGDNMSTTSGGKESSTSEENLSCEPFVFAAMKTNSDSFTPKNMKILCKVSFHTSFQIASNHSLMDK